MNTPRMALVPLEVTMDQLAAAQAAFLKDPEGRSSTIYKASLVAAPNAGKVSGKQLEKMAKAMFEAPRWKKGAQPEDPPWTWEDFPCDVLDPRRYYLNLATIASRALGLEIESREKG